MVRAGRTGLPLNHRISPSWLADSTASVADCWFDGSSRPRMDAGSCVAYTTSTPSARLELRSTACEMTGLPFVRATFRRRGAGKPLPSSTVPSSRTNPATSTPAAKIATRLRRLIAKRGNDIVVDSVHGIFSCLPTRLAGCLERLGLSGLRLSPLDRQWDYTPMAVGRNPVWIR